MKDNEYTTVTNDLESVGDLRVRFRYLDLDKLGVVTIVAKQENGQLVEYVADNQDIVYEIFRGDLTKEQIIERMNENNHLGYMGVAITFAVLLIIGLFVFRDNIGDFLDKHPQFKVDVSDNIIQVFVIVVFAGLFILITSLSLNSIFKSVRAKNAVPVTATVTAFRDACRDDAEAYYYTYEYNVNDIVYEKSYDNVTSLPFSLSNPTPDGDVAEFEAYYNPEKPSESFIAQERAFPYVVVGCLIFFDAIFILGIAKATSNIIAETKKKN